VRKVDTGMQEAVTLPPGLLKVSRRGMLPPETADFLLECLVVHADEKRHTYAGQDVKVPRR
jgi:hypothetical protein